MIDSRPSCGSGSLVGERTCAHGVAKLAERQVHVAINGYHYENQTEDVTDMRPHDLPPRQMAS